MATLKRQREDGNWEYLQMTGEDVITIKNDFVAHLADKANPHGITKTQVGLENVDNVKQIPLTEKGQPNGVAALDANGNVLNGNGEISGGSQSGEFTDTTTVLQPLAIYTKRIPLSGKATLGRMRAIRDSGTKNLVAEFSTIRTQTTGFTLYRGASSSTEIGYDKHQYGVFGSNSVTILGSNICLYGLWIDESTNQLVLEFKNIHTSIATTLSITRTLGNGQTDTTGLIWEVW